MTFEFPMKLLVLSTVLSVISFTASSGFSPGLSGISGSAISCPDLVKRMSYDDWWMWLMLILCPSQSIDTSIVNTAISPPSLLRIGMAYEVIHILSPASS